MAFNHLAPNTLAAHDPGWKWRSVARVLVALAMILSLGYGVGPAAAAQASTTFLLASDGAAQKLYVYRLPDLERIAQFDDIVLGAHAGTVTLPDGRVLFVDDKAAEFVVLQLTPTGAPTLARASIPTPTPFGRAGWAMVDPSASYFAVSSDDDGAAQQTVSILDLTTMQVGQLRLDLKKNAAGAYEEVHPYLGGTPLTLWVTAGEEIRAFSVADVMAAGTAQPLSVTPLGMNPHGPVFSSAHNRLYVTTADGFAMLDVQGNVLGQPRIARWEAGGLRHTQNFRPRLAYDGSTIYGAVTALTNPALTAREWAQSEAYVHVLDLPTETRGLIRLARGIVGRFQLSERYAVFSNIHPDGDAALLFDVDPASPRFQQVVARIPLERLSNGPVAGEPPAGKEGRSVGITPDGAWVFVSHGGDGRISVIETATARVVNTIEAPTSLKGGGYLAGVQLGSRLVDPSTR